MGTGVTGYFIVFCQITIVIVFLYSAVTKAGDMRAFEQAIANFHILPKQLNKPAAWLFLAGEFLVVLLTVMGGQYLVLGFALAGILLLIFSLALASVLVRKISTSCNCFGSNAKLVSNYDLWRNAGFIACALLGWGIKTNNVAQVNLQTIEVGLIGIVAAVFVVVWINLGEIMKVIR